MSKIIVSYRCSDSATITGRIYDRLADRYGEDSWTSIGSHSVPTSVITSRARCMTPTSCWR